MQTMFHYSIKEHVSYPQTRKRYQTLLILQCFTLLATYVFVHTAQLMTHPMHLDISENLLNKLDKQLAINLKSLRVLVLAL